VNETDTSAPAEPTEGTMTDEEIERGRSQVGVAVKAKYSKHRPRPEEGAMREFARGYGDDNPLFNDPAYAATSRWRAMIAPPLFPIAVGVDFTPRIEDPETRARFRSLFRGVGKYYAGCRWHFFRPIQANDETLYEYMLGDLEVKDQSGFSGGRSVLEVEQTFHVNRLGEPVALREEDYISAERQASKRVNKYGDIRQHTYTDDEIRDIESAYDNEVRRGEEPRIWEDVEVGNPIGTVVKGPWTVGDLIAMHMGMGWEGYGVVYPLKFAHQNRAKIPAFYTRDAYNVPDSAQRLHWDPERARELGLPTSYDYGQMRSCWLTHLITNWMGDDAWLWRFANQMRGFNFLGDTHWCTGEVVAKRVEQDHHVVDLELRATNQDGRVTAPATATVILPSRSDGPVQLPTAPSHLRRRGVSIVANEAARRRARP
jgi:acyl dehydratase